MTAGMRWISRAAAAEELQLTEEKVAELIDQRVLVSRVVGGDDHLAISADSVAAYAAVLDARQRTEHSPPAWEPWAAAEDPDAFADRNDSDDEEGETA